MIVCIDGGVATGKSAVGRRVAEALRLPFVDTGLYYRAVTLASLERGVDAGDGSALAHLAAGLKVVVDGRRAWVDGVEVTDRLYDPRISEHVSSVAKVAGVRLAMMAQQRASGRGGVVMVGRDIGTVVFPDAEFKFFLTASVDERVRRRAAQMAARGEPVDESRMRTEVSERDRIDSSRTVSPLKPADDAVVVDTDHLDLEGVVRHIVDRVAAAAP